MSIFGRNQSTRAFTEAALKEQQRQYESQLQQLLTAPVGAPVQFGTTSQSPPAVPTEVVEQIDTEILAWRGWVLDPAYEDEPTLRSITYHTPWEGPVLTADKPPASGTTHGIYALKAKPALGEQDFGYFCKAAFGEVALSGQVIIGQRGYRAERAVIRSLWLANPAYLGEFKENMCLWELAGVLEQKYGVEVLVAAEKWEKWEAALVEMTKHNAYRQQLLGSFR
jgi:hypothetical protein